MPSPPDPPSDSPLDFADPEPPKSNRTRLPSVPAIPPGSPAAATVAPLPIGERACPRCGMRVAGKPAPVRCPRCSAQWDANFPDLLQYSPPAWVARLSAGALLMASVPVIHIVATALGRAATRTEGGLVHAVAEVLLLIATFMVTLREPEQPLPAPPSAAWSRGFALAASLAWIAAGILHFQKIGTPYWVSLYLCFVFSAAQAAALGVFLRTLCLRIPNDDLASSSQNFMWMVPALNFFFIADKHLVLEEWFASGFYCSIPLVGGLCVFMLWVSSYLLRLALNLRAVTAAAETLTATRVQLLAANAPGKPGG